MVRISKGGKAVPYTGGKTPRKQLSAHANRKSVPAPGGIKRIYRARPGVKALRLIKKEQKSVKPIVSLAAHSRIARHLVGEHKNDMRMSKHALTSSREIAESEVMKELGASHIVALSCGKKSLDDKEIKVVERVEHELHGNILK